MTSQFFRALTAATTALVILGSGATLAEPQHGIAMYGTPALPPDFVSLPYANPDAPKGGRITYGENGTFDSLNPFITNGSPAAGLSSLTVETLMGRSYDEPFSLYGLLAESIETDEARTWVQFTLRPEARFSDGTPVTVEDVIWSMETLGTVGHPRYHGAWSKVASAEKIDDRTVKFTFAAVDRELPLILGLRPIISRAQWEGKDFATTATEPVTGSGPYIVGPYDMGAQITYIRNPNWWGADLPFYRGSHNFDEVRYDYFGDGGVVFEAFKGGVISSYRETNPVKWAGNYDFPAVTSGDVIKSEIAHSRPSGIEGFVFNTRKPMFADWRVREALITAFNFEFVNQTLNGGAQPRITSYYGNSTLGMQPGTPATGPVLALLEPFKADLLPGAIDGYTLPVSDGSEANRANIRAASDLLAEVGYTVENGVLTGPDGAPFTFEILLVNGADDMIGAASIYVEALKRLGITATITTVDSAQYKERTNAYDFDMTHYIRSLSLSPGNEQTAYWGAAGVTEPNTRNWMGMNSPAAEAMIQTMLSTTDPAAFRDAVEALDRVLISGRYVIPTWYSQISRMAHRKELKFPERLPLYGDWAESFSPTVWWYQE
ncbi:MAG: extracellular solute-binding protein [Paracoccaceae bacterium]